MIGVLLRTWPKLSEAAIANEILGLERCGLALTLHALEEPLDAVFGEAVEAVRAPVHRVPGLNRRAELALGCADFVRRTPPALIAGARLFAATHHGAHAEGVLDRALWLAARLAKDGVRHLHVYGARDTADVAEIASRLTGIPFSLSVHGEDAGLCAPDALRRKLQAAAFAVVATEHDGRCLGALAAGARMHRVYRGIDTRRFRPGATAHVDDRPLLLSVGRLREKKGFDTLVEACARLVARGRRFRAVVIGYGPEREALQVRITAQGLDDVITLAGKQPQHVVLEHYRRATVFALASRVAADGDRDDLPSPLLEAMACGLPVVATRVGGIPELVADGVNGRLVAPDDPVALADAIGALLDDRLLAGRLGRVARATVEAQHDAAANVAVLGTLLGAHAATKPVVAPARAGRVRERRMVEARE